MKLRMISRACALDEQHLKESLMCFGTRSRPLTHVEMAGDVNANGNGLSGVAHIIRAKTAFQKGALSEPSSSI
jgi:hypothetical protein